MSEKIYEFTFSEVADKSSMVVMRQVTESQVRGSTILTEAREALRQAKVKAKREQHRHAALKGGEA